MREKLTVSQVTASGSQEIQFQLSPKQLAISQSLPLPPAVLARKLLLRASRSLKSSTYQTSIAHSVMVRSEHIINFKYLVAVASTIEINKSPTESVGQASGFYGTSINGICKRFNCLFPIHMADQANHKHD